MASCDVKDAFLQVCQEDPILVTLQGEQFVINRNLPGQRLGAKQWFLFLKDFLQSSMGFEFCSRTTMFGQNGTGDNSDPCG